MIALQHRNLRKAYFLNEFNVIKSAMFKLCSTTRKSKVFTSNFDPVLMTLIYNEFCMWSIFVPYLQ